MEQLLKDAIEYLQKVGTELEQNLLVEQYEKIGNKWVITERPMDNDDIISTYMHYMGN